MTNPQRFWQDYLPTLGACFWTALPHAEGCSCHRHPPTALELWAEGAARLVKPWEAASITPPWREWTFIKSLPQARSLPGVLAYWIFQNLHNSPVRWVVGFLGYRLGNRGTEAHVTCSRSQSRIKNAIQVQLKSLCFPFLFFSFY